MGSQWFANMRGAALDDEQMKDIPHPTAELYVHVTTKTIQAGGLLGMVLFAPIATVLKKETRNLASLQTKMTRFGRNGVIIGTVMGPFMTFMKLRNENDDYKVWDRCYRLRYNRNQVRVDQASVSLGVGGAIAGALAGQGVLFGGLAGMVVGILSAATFNSIQKKD